MKKNHQIKRKHHHVWSYYLKQWSHNDRDVHYTTKKNKIACDSVSGLACEIDFYKVNFFNQDDVTFIKNFSQLSPEGLRESHELFLNDFVKISQIASYQHHPTFPDELKKEIKLLEHNPLENLHSSFERDAHPILQNLIQGKLSVLNDKDNMLQFMSYLGQQIGRSKAMKDNVFKAILNRERYPSNAPYSYDTHVGLFEKNWWFLSFMFGMNIGASLYLTREKDTHAFLVNDSNEPFITTDNPIINIHNSLAELSPFDAPTECDFYYPISPKYAYMVNHSSTYNQGITEITEQEAKSLNQKIAKKANHHLIAQTKEQLEAIKKHIRGA